MNPSYRNYREIKHGKMLANLDTELIWGWNTSAGKLRAKRRADLIIKQLNFNNFNNKAKVLEIGCGTGMFTELFAKLLAKTNIEAEITAIDISKDLLNKALTRNLAENKVKFLEKKLEDLQDIQAFDAVIGSSVLHHIDINLALKKIHALLKTNGVMSFAEPNMLNPQIFIERKFRKFFSSVSPDETAFIKNNLKKDLIKAGFSEVKITEFDWLHPFTPKSLINLILNLGLKLENIPVLKEFAGSLLIFGRRL